MKVKYNIVFLSSITICAAFILYGAIFTKQFETFTTALTQYIAVQFSWYYLILVVIFLALCLYLLFSKYPLRFSLMFSVLAMSLPTEGFSAIISDFIISPFQIQYYIYCNMYVAHQNFHLHRKVLIINLIDYYTEVLLWKLFN